MRRSFQEFLKQQLQGPLPGKAAHQKLMQHRKSIEELDFSKVKPRQSAVLILLYYKNHDWHTVFIERASYEGVHSGQIALPGGKHENFDIDLKNTALREAEEELNIRATKVEIAGKLSSLYVPPSNFLIAPYVGFYTEKPDFRADTTEVASFFEVPLQNLVGENQIVDQTVTLADQTRIKAKGYAFKKHLIWGATAMMVKEFAEIVEDFYTT